MCEPFHVDLETWSLNHGIFWRLEVTQDFSWHPQSRPTSGMAMACWHIHTPIHSIWRLWITLCMFGDGEGVRAIPHGFIASTTAPSDIFWRLAVTHDFNCVSEGQTTAYHQWWMEESGQIHQCQAHRKCFIVFICCRCASQYCSSHWQSIWLLT